MQRDEESKAYRVYVTDALRVIGKNTALICHGEYIGKRYTEFIHPKPEDKRTSEEIIAHIKKKLEVSAGEPV